MVRSARRAVLCLTIVGQPAYDQSMATVTLRELARNTAAVIQEIQTTRRPALVTRNGKPVVALVPIDEVALEDWLLRESADIRGQLR